MIPRVRTQLELLLNGLTLVDTTILCFVIADDAGLIIICIGPTVEMLPIYSKMTRIPK